MGKVLDFDNEIIELVYVWVSIIGGYLVNIYFRPGLHAFDMASDGMSVIILDWNHTLFWGSDVLEHSCAS